MARARKAKTVQAAESPAGLTPTHSREAIEWRAYEIYQARGAVHGNDLDDWLQAEQELREKQPS